MAAKTCVNINCVLCGVCVSVQANLAACLVTGSSTTQSVRQEVMSAKTLSVQDELAGLQRVRRLR